MLRIFGRRAGPMRLLGLAAAATLMLSAGTARRAEALTLINPATSPAAKAATDDLFTQVRQGPGGHRFHGGGFRGGGFHRGGGHVGGFHGGGFRGGHIGGFRAAPAFHHRHVGYRHHGFRYGGYGGYRHWGHHRPHFRHRHFYRPYYVGGYYPTSYYPRRCRIIWTYYGPRRVCHWPRWRYPYRYYW